ncbi:MAG: NPCBM/NEW2 domain-containing protein [Pirellulaceae bacterium]
MISILTLCCCLGAEPEVVVKPLRGEPLQGALVELSATRLTLRAGGQTRQFETSGLESFRPVGSATPDAADQAQVWVELVDGSAFAGATFTAAAGQCTMTGGATGTLSMSLPRVRSVRFYAPQEQIRAQWKAIAAESAPGDVLVIRKISSSASGASEVALDQLTGVVHGVTDATVSFEFDGERLDVSRAKIEGIVLRGATSRETDEPYSRVRDAAGGIWNARDVSFGDGRLELTTVAGVRVPLPWNQVQEVDYSAANLMHLAEIEMESAAWRPYFQSSLTPKSLSRWFEPRFEAVALGGRSYDRSLVLHSRSVVSYRLSRNFRQLVAVVGIDERLRHQANLGLTILGDGQPLFQRTIRGDQEPFELDLPIDGVRRLRIEVDFGEDRSDVGDLLYLAEPRLVK